MRPGLLLTFAAMGLATYLTRAPLLVVLARRRLPGWLERYFAALPIALITALALPLVLLAPGSGPAGPPGWVTDLPAAAVVAVLARRTGHLLVAVAGGVVLAALLRALLG
jgi:branched-subunit amino acid transport protein